MWKTGSGKDEAAFPDVGILSETDVQYRSVSEGTPL